MAKVQTKASVRAKTAKSSGGAAGLGTTKDGVRILKPRGKATHFSQKELRDAVAAVRAAKQA